MHYRNGREAKNGDKIISLMYLERPFGGILRDAQPGNDYCNGYVQTGATPGTNDPMACLCDCVHIDDFGEALRAAGIYERPVGK